MRKILLASVATVAMTGVAAASGLEPTLGSSSSSIINKAEPGKAVVRLDGFVFFSAGFASNTVDKAPNGAKADGYGFLSTFRIYPAFDAQTPGGLRYGAFAEVRSNSNTGGTNGGVGTGGSRGTNTVARTPLPDPDSTFNCPPKRARRSRILYRPKPPLANAGWARTWTSKPRPQSATQIRRFSPSSASVRSASDTPECITTLNRSSRTNWNSSMLRSSLATL